MPFGPYYTEKKWEKKWKKTKKKQKTMDQGAVLLTR